jgi:FkbM family methyltransferase
MTIAARLKNKLRLIAASCNLRPSRFTSLSREIGGAGAAEVFAHYIKNHEELSGDSKFTAFMQFYADNWQTSTSQWSQDVFIMFATKMKQHGTFLEIGGADGVTHSNTFSLEKHLEWRGTLVEPDPSQFSILRKFRPANTLINAAVTPVKSNSFVRLRQVGQLSALEGLEGRDMHLKARLESNSFARVPAISLTDILSEQTFDYFSFDIEGAELEILNKIDWDKIKKPHALTVEHNFRDEDKVKLSKLLALNGYIEHFSEHDWLRRGDIWATLST